MMTGAAGGHRVAVVGGGIAGLAAAHRLQELARERNLSLDLLLLEAGKNLGGTIGTERSGGFVIEAGPDSFISEKPWALDLCRRIGLSDRLVGTRDEHRQTFIVRDGVLRPLPDGFLLLAPTRLWPLAFSRLFSWPAKLRMALDLVLPRGPALSDESLGSFVTRRLGREALERVAQPLVGGIYAADPDTLSLAATMPRFLDMERKHRSIILAMARQRRVQQRHTAIRGSAPGERSGARWSLFVSLDDGMQGLVEILAARLPPGTVRVGTAVSAVLPGTSRAGTWHLCLPDGASVEVDAAILATPAHHTARLVADLDQRLAEQLSEITYASSATVTLAYRRVDVPHPLDAFGFVVPFIEARSIIACTFSSVKYPGRAPEDHVLLRSFVGGTLQASCADLDDASMEAAVRRELAELLGIPVPPELVRIHRHPQAMPQYCVGHIERVGAINAQLSRHRGLALAGSAYGGVGIPDCIHGGEAAAEAIIAALS
jgi:oxygen-dependent protoporphyrinogen oxidase